MQTADHKNQSTIHMDALGKMLRIGDIVFTHLPPFKPVSQATQCWVNHVGIVTDILDGEILISESKVPISKKTSLERFIARSSHKRVAVMRLKSPLTLSQQQKLVQAAERRLGIHYDTGFNAYSMRQFCSRFVQEVVKEAVGIEVGKLETFETLLKKNPNVKLLFWRIWFFGGIPWQRKTITPASVYWSEYLDKVFDGWAVESTELVVSEKKDLLQPYELSDLCTYLI